MVVGYGGVVSVVCAALRFTRSLGNFFTVHYEIGSNIALESSFQKAIATA